MKKRYKCLNKNCINKILKLKRFSQWNWTKQEVKQNKLRINVWFKKIIFLSYLKWIPKIKSTVNSSWQKSRNNPMPFWKEMDISCVEFPILKKISLQNEGKSKIQEISLKQPKETLRKCLRKFTRDKK